MKILVTGANGQLGQEICNIPSASHEIIGLTRKEMDITDQGNGEIILKHKPRLLYREGILWNADDIGIMWPLTTPALAERDQRQSLLKNAKM